MRLLHFNNDGQFSLTEFFDDDIPDYAILSHRWGPEEVTFRELTDGTSKGKAGYGKIQFCGAQARRDSLEYFWVDTCCIDKSSSAELSEAINSMFRWYQKAVTCYVYLSDVSTLKRKASDASAECTWESAFRASKWFTRGWTLQELLAPRSVEFFSREGKRLGEKRTLEQQIHEITGIPAMALRDNPLSHFDIDERFSWVKTRQTTRGEDKAYSLFGIFDVQMPLLYGEGEGKSFQRLREAIDKPSRGKLCSENDLLRHLPYAEEAPFNSYNRQYESACLPDTRVDLLQGIYNWADAADGQDERCIFWLNGLAGTGKSTISRTVAHRYNDQKRLGASFFFSKGGGDASHAGKFFTSIAVQLACNVPSLRQYIRDATKKRSDIASLSLSEQWRQLVLGPLSKILTKPCHSYIIVIDALDECEDNRDVQTIVKLLAEAQSSRVRLRIFLTSRPEIPIRHGICAVPQAQHKDFVLHNIQPSIVNHDISVFLEYNLGRIGQELTLGADWPGEKVLRELVLYASGLFIWAATACRFVREGKWRFARKRLDRIINGSSSAITAPEKHLDEIYLAVLKHSMSDYLNEEKEEAYDILKFSLGSIVVLLSPLSVSSLSRILRLPKEELDQTFKDLHAILNVPENPTHQLRLHHPSFRDFLFNKDRSGNFWIEEKEAHHLLATGCINLMSQTLKKDICEMHTLSGQTSQVESDWVKKCLPPEIQYACLYWVQHLQRSGFQLHDSEVAHRFLQAHLLHWLEALGWMGKTSEGIQAILALESHVSAIESPNLRAFIYDAKRFALYNRSVIEQAPLQLYCSALIFAPENSIIRRQFERSIPTWIQWKTGVGADWSPSLQTLERHSSYVNSVAFSTDGKQVVSGSCDNTVRLWDAATGALQQTLNGHSSRVTSVAFSPDGKQVVSGSYDNTVRLWDAVTGTFQQMLEGHSLQVSSVAFSPDSKQVVSGSYDKTVRLWDAVTGTFQQMLEGHSLQVSSVAFSPDSKQVVSGSYDKTVRLWDAVTRTFQQMLKGHSLQVSSVAFSPDSKQVVSGSYDKTVRLWDATTGALQQTLVGHSTYVSSVAFSSNGKQVVSGSWDNTVRLWDTTTKVLQQTLKGHSSRVTSVAFSPDYRQVVSGSYDSTVRLWDAATKTFQQTLEGHSSYVNPVAFSPDGKQAVSGSYDKTVRLWDAATGALQQTLEGHSSRVTPVAFSPDGKQVVSGSYDNTVRLWDATTGALQQTLKGHSSQCTPVAFSPDCKQVVFGSDDNIVQLWDATTGDLQQTLKGHLSRLTSVAFSLSSKQVISGSDDNTIRLWDTATGVLQQTLKGHSLRISSVAFSPDGKQIVSGSDDKTVRLWDATVGALQRTLEGHSSYVSSVVFSPDGRQVVSGSWDNTVRLWDAATGILQQMLVGHSSHVNSMVFSPNGRLLPHLNVNSHWLAEGSANLLWLPTDYRATCAA
ncbi:hypothetical protein IFR05_005321 [Cadophora sp. M221]|nr:hypothetical protein IFR05_005321 [Cadophora sp. M221]